MPNPIKVLNVMPLAEMRGGGEQMFLHLLEHGRGAGVEWSVAFFSDGPMVQAAKNWGLETFIVRTGRLRHPHRMALAVIQLRQIIKLHHISAVLSWMGKGQIYGGTAAALAGVPAIWYQLSLPNPPTWQDRAATWLPSKAVLTCSQSATTAQSRLKPHRPTITVNPGVNLARFNPAILPIPLECRRKLNLPLLGPLIGIVGRLQRWKGMHHLIDAMPAVLKHHPDAHAVIVGGEHAFEPDYLPYIKERIASQNLHEHVTLAGLRSDVPEWMQAMDIIVHASDAEPFGIVVVEAMALGKPVIATNTAGPAEIITNGLDGILWQAGQPQELAEAILKLLNDRDLSKRIAAQASIRSHYFDVQRFADGVSQAVTQAVAA